MTFAVALIVAWRHHGAKPWPDGRPGWMEEFGGAAEHQDSDIDQDCKAQVLQPFTPTCSTGSRWRSLCLQPCAATRALRSPSSLCLAEQSTHQAWVATTGDVCRTSGRQSTTSTELLTSSRGQSAADPWAATQVLTAAWGNHAPVRTDGRTVRCGMTTVRLVPHRLATICGPQPSPLAALMGRLRWVAASRWLDGLLDFALLRLGPSATETTPPDARGGATSRRPPTTLCWHNIYWMRRAPPRVERGRRDRNVPAAGGRGRRVRVWTRGKRARSSGKSSSKPYEGRHCWRLPPPAATVSCLGGCYARPRGGRDPGGGGAVAARRRSASWSGCSPPRSNIQMQPPRSAHCRARRHGPATCPSSLEAESSTPLGRARACRGSPRPTVAPPTYAPSSHTPAARRPLPVGRTDRPAGGGGDACYAGPAGGGETLQ